MKFLRSPTIIKPQLQFQKLNHSPKQYKKRVVSISCFSRRESANSNFKQHENEKKKIISTSAFTKFKWKSFASEPKKDNNPLIRVCCRVRVCVCVCVHARFSNTLLSWAWKIEGERRTAPKRDQQLSDFFHRFNEVERLTKILAVRIPYFFSKVAITFILRKNIKLNPLSSFWEFIVDNFACKAFNFQLYKTEREILSLHKNST